MVFLYSFASFKNQERKIHKIEVDFNTNDYPFLNEEMVNNLLIQNFQGTSKVKKDRVDLKKLEDLLDANRYVKKSEVYCSIDGLLSARIIQRKPIIRVVNENQSYYLDEFGSKMPLSENFTPRVPVFYGVINENELKYLVTLFQHLDQDELLKQNIIDITKSSRGNLIFSVRDYDYKIIFGTTKNLEKKLKNYKAFLQFTSNDTLLKSYKKVNLIFTEQVVCTK